MSQWLHNLTTWIGVRVWPSMIAIAVLMAVNAYASDVLSPQVLSEELNKARQIIADADRLGTRLFAELESTNQDRIDSASGFPRKLVEYYATLGRAMPIVEGVIIESGNAPATHARVLAEAKSVLEKIGFQFSRAQPHFGRVMYGGGWDALRIATTVKGRKTSLYKDTLRKVDSWKLTAAERKQLYADKLSEFFGRKGNIKDIVRVKGMSEFLKLESAIHYDYVLFPSGRMNLYSTDGSKFPKMGHSILANHGGSFADPNVLLAGEIWVYKTRQGRIIAVAINNNSGHFLPEYSDLKNALSFLMKFGFTKEQIILFGAPDNLKVIFADAEKIHGIPTKSLLPISVGEWRKRLYTRAPIEKPAQ